MLMGEGEGEGKVVKRTRMKERRWGVNGCRSRGVGIRGLLKKPSREVGKVVESFGGWTGGSMDEPGDPGGWDVLEIHIFHISIGRFIQN